jgi:CheY-like chemotaxis protein
VRRGIPVVSREAVSLFARAAEPMKKVETQKPGSKPAGGRSARVASEIIVLHIDDDPNDTALLQAAARSAKLGFRLHNVEDGEQAIAFLSGVEPYSDRALYPLPSLILLDLKMPRATGFEVLKWVRTHPELGGLPVVVLSGSELQDDVEKAYVDGANSYLVKPIGFEALVNLVSNISTIWLGTLGRPAV